MNNINRLYDIYLNLFVDIMSGDTYNILQEGTISTLRATYQGCRDVHGGIS